jgi:hypothetical protein
LDFSELFRLLGLSHAFDLPWFDLLLVEYWFFSWVKLRLRISQCSVNLLIQRYFGIIKNDVIIDFLVLRFFLICLCSNRFFVLKLIYFKKSLRLILQLSDSIHILKSYPTSAECTFWSSWSPSCYPYWIWNLVLSLIRYYSEWPLISSCFSQKYCFRLHKKSPCKSWFGHHWLHWRCPYSLHFAGQWHR